MAASDNTAHPQHVAERSSTTSNLSARSEELRAIRDTIPPNSLYTCAHNFVRFMLAPDTPSRSLTVTCLLSERYPSEGLELELQSQMLPAESLDKLKSMCELEVWRRARESQPQALHVWLTLSDIFRRNRLLPCVAEIRKTQALLKGPKESVKLSEANGTIRVCANEPVLDFKIQFQLKVGNRYPYDPVVVTCVESSFPHEINDMFFKQAQDIARRCSQGWQVHQALRDSDVAKQQQTEASVITCSSLSQVKHDIKFIKEKAEWTQIATNRKLRQQKKLFEKRELNREKEASDAVESLAGIASDSTHPIAVTTTTTPCPSVFAVAEFLITKFLRLLPASNCVACDKPLIHSVAAFSSDNPPQRAYCGHWFHDKCLELLMTHPPFGSECPGGCGGRVFHSKWTSDMKALEKRWATREKRRREEEEVLDLLDLS